MNARTLVLAFSVTILLPSSASALTLVQIVGLFHIAVGLLLTATLLTFATGIGMYLARLNTWPSHRDAAIRVLEWGVAMLFVLLLLLALANFLQNHSAIALPILAGIILIVAAIFIVRMAAATKKKPPER